MDGANGLVRAISTARPGAGRRQRHRRGVGCSAALASDIIVARESAAFLLAFARIGLMPDGGASATVAASIGRARAMRMALLAEPLPPRRPTTPAWSPTPPRRVVRPDVAGLVTAPGRGPPLAHTATKRAVNAATLGGGSTRRSSASAPGSGCRCAPRRRRGHAGVLRAAPAGVPRGVGASWAADHVTRRPLYFMPLQL